MRATWIARLVRLAAALGLAGLLVWVDLATKRWAATELSHRGQQSLIDGLLVLRTQTNSGIAFGLFQPHLLPWKARFLVHYKTAMAIVLTALLAWRCLRPRPEWLAPLGLTGLLAGTVGNLVDRARNRGSVVDFIAVNAGAWRWPAFNLADLFLAVGLVLVVVALVRGLRRREAPAPS